MSCISTVTTMNTGLARQRNPSPHFLGQPRPSGSKSTTVRTKAVLDAQRYATPYDGYR